MSAGTSSVYMIGLGLDVLRRIAGGGATLMTEMVVPIATATRR